MRLFGLLLFGAAAGLVYWGIGSLSGALCSDNTGSLILKGVLFSLGIIACIALGALTFTGFDAFEKFWSCAVGVVLVLGCVGAMFYFANRKASQVCPAAEITSALQDACRGDGNPLAGTVERTQAGDAQVVVLEAQGGISKYANRAPTVWKPASLADADLVLCIAEPSEVRLDTCNYAGGGDIERYRRVIYAELVSARTGERVANKTFTCQPRDCLPWELGFINKLSCKVKVGQVFDYFEEIVAKLPAAALSVSEVPLLTPTPMPPTPTRTAAASSTPRPSPTPQPSATVKASSARLRRQPNTTSATLAGLRQGDPVRIIGVNAAGDWVKVSLPDGQQGWILAELLSLSVPVETLPVVE
jgi:hypothetical protein